MTEKPNCSNCPSCDRDTGTWDYCNEGDFAIDPLETKEKIGIVGCLSHPGAREYLMAPVIAELERLQSIIIENNTVYEDYGGRNARYAYENAITLIKNGVDRE